MPRDQALITRVGIEVHLQIQEKQAKSLHLHKCSRQNRASLHFSRVLLITNARICPCLLILCHSNWHQMNPANTGGSQAGLSEAGLSELHYSSTLHQDHLSSTFTQFSTLRDSNVRVGGTPKGLLRPPETKTSKSDVNFQALAPTHDFISKIVSLFSALLLF